jgi:hypothetical protein
VADVTDYLIEQWARDPAALTPEQRQAVNERIAEHPEAQAAATFWQSFFSSNEALQSTVSARVQRFVDTLFTCPARLVLTPLAEEVGGGAVLQARTAAGPGSRFRCIATLAHEGHNMVMRLLHDAEATSAAYRLYLLADDPALTAHALVDLPALDRTVQADASGRAVFGLAEPPPPEALTEATVHRLLGQVPADAERGAATHTFTEGATVRLSPTETQVAVHVRTEAKAVAIDRVVVGREDPPRVVRLSSGHARLPLAAAEQSLYFYG